MLNSLPTWMLIRRIFAVMVLVSTIFSAFSAPALARISPNQTLQGLIDTSFCVTDESGEAQSKETGQSSHHAENCCILCLSPSFSGAAFERNGQISAPLFFITLADYPSATRDFWRIPFPGRWPAPRAPPLN